MRRIDGGWLIAIMVSVAVPALGDVLSSGQHHEVAWAVENPQLPTESLTAEEIRALQEGEGMGLARAAELNGYPGPVHILEAAREGKIHLDPEQRQAIERIQAAMKAEARVLGQEILAGEARLEAAFRDRRMDEADLARQVGDLGRQRTALRLTHLVAHLLTAGLLRPEQIGHYNQLRGYAAQSPAQHHGH